MGKSRIKPEDPFPADLNQLADHQVEVLNSKVHRQIDAEYVQQGEPHPETAHRQEELDEELDDRDLMTEAVGKHAAETAQQNRPAKANAAEDARPG